MKHGAFFAPIGQPFAALALSRTAGILTPLRVRLTGLYCTLTPSGVAQHRAADLDLGSMRYGSRYHSDEVMNCRKLWAESSAVHFALRTFWWRSLARSYRGLSRPHPCGDPGSGERDLI